MRKTILQNHYQLPKTRLTASANHRLPIQAPRHTLVTALPPLPRSVITWMTTYTNRIAVRHHRYPITELKRCHRRYHVRSRSATNLGSKSKTRPTATPCITIRRHAVSPKTPAKSSGKWRSPRTGLSTVRLQPLTR